MKLPDYHSQVRQAIEYGLRREMDGIGDASDGIERGVLDFHNQMARNGLRVIEGFGDCLDRRRWGDRN